MGQEAHKVKVDVADSCHGNGNLLHRGTVVAMILGSLAGEAGMAPGGDIPSHAMPHKAFTDEPLGGMHTQLQESV